MTNIDTASKLEQQWHETDTLSSKPTLEILEPHNLNIPQCQQSANGERVISFKHSIMRTTVKDTPLHSATSQLQRDRFNRGFRKALCQRFLAFSFSVGCLHHPPPNEGPVHGSITSKSKLRAPGLPGCIAHMCSLRCSFTADSVNNTIRGYELRSTRLKHKPLHNPNAPPRSKAPERYI